MPKAVEASLNAAILAGTVVGQLGFGALADVYGRKRMYGLELLIIIVSTLGVAMSASGAAGSMSLTAWLIAWRFFLGIGIGGDYPLSAIITSEFAPTKSRGRMLATVFFMQPCGYLLATIVSIVALAAYKDHIPTTLPPPGTLQTCLDDECRRAVDSVWRWVVGFGTIPATIAIFFRFTIPESPRYTIEVLNRPDEALEDVNEMGLPASSPEPSHDTEMQEQAQQAQHHLQGPQPHLDRSCTSSPGSPIFRASPAIDGMYVPNANLLGSGNRISMGSTILTSEDRPASVMSPTTLPHEETDESSDDEEEPNAWIIYFSGLKEYLWTQGYWVVVLGTSLTWFCFDFAFYLMSPNSYEVVAKAFNEPSASSTGDVYGDLMDNSWHSIILVSLGSMIGGIAMIFLIGRFSPRTLQIAGFLILFVLFIIVGLCFKFLSSASRTPLIVFLYIISQIFFEIGPNFTTYIIPAELFPTRFRCTGHGISAASGKLAAVLVQVFAVYSPVGPHGTVNSFGYTIIVFAVFMLSGAGLTTWLIPETRTADGKSRPLEKLEYIGKPSSRKDRAASTSHAPSPAMNGVETRNALPSTVVTVSS
jgi:PHS family inorganic phosphate transporter-like MFS transporter